MPGARNVIGIDPAPSKPSTVARLVDGRVAFIHCAVPQLRALLSKAVADRALVCWDAPLTGPASIEAAGAQQRDFSTRKIESFFNSASGLRAPKGISVRGYSGCPHWAISRSLVGHPIVGLFDQREPQFQLLTAINGRQNDSPQLVEVHPALALWLWSRWEGSLSRDQPGLQYKGVASQFRHAAMAEAQRLLCNGLERSGLAEYATLLNSSWSDDELDAFIALLLGLLFEEGNPAITLLGTAATGCMLLPDHPELRPKWNKFTSNKVL